MSNLKQIRKAVPLAICVKAENGVRYFTVYQVRALDNHGNKVFVDCYLNLKDAERRVKFINANCRHIYGVSYVFELKVLC